jgi:D(-)-tartrate dehydratase
MVRIVAAREQTIGLSSGSRNADIDFTEMTASAVVLISDTRRNGKPVVGLAFDSIGRYGHGGLLHERFFPRLLNADPADYAADRGAGIDPLKIWSVVMRNEKAGGHGERPGAVGLIDAASWDLQAKLEDKPLWRLIQERFPGATGRSVPVYASGGQYRPVDDLAGLGEEIRRFRDLGYGRFKIKTGGLPVDGDRRRIETVLGLLGDKASALAVDCNCGFDRDTAPSRLAALDEYCLAWIEDPVDPLDYALQAELAPSIATPLAMGENIFSAADTRNLLRYGGLRPDRDLFNMDISLSYGMVEYRRVLELLASWGWSRRQCWPHAGHLFSLHVCVGLGLGGHETAPFHNPIGGFPEDVRIEDGCIWPGETPGLGLDRKPHLAPVFADMLD